MRSVAFYSYKGGTGRTLALANVATLAARAGKRVIAIDMDLEAPGLTYKLLTDQINPHRCRGLVGCLLDSLQHGGVPAELGDYLIDVPLPELSRPPRVPGGWLKLMPAGVVPSPNYFGDLRALALDERAARGEATDLVWPLIERLGSDLAPDLVLIDARTGVTNTNLLVLSDLADAVFMFFLDRAEQLDGVRMVMRAVAPLARDAKRPVALHGVICRVATDEAHVGAGWVESPRDHERRTRIEGFLTAPAAPVRHTVDSVKLFHLHDERALLGREVLLVDELDAGGGATSALVWDYHRLAAAVIDDAPAIARYAEPLRLSGSAEDAARAAVLMGDPAVRAVAGSHASAGAIAERAGPGLLEEIQTLRAEAARDPRARPRLAATLLQLANAERGIGRRADAIAPTEEAVEIYRPLAAENPAFRNDLASSLNNLGLRYSETGRRADAVAPTEEAVEIYRPLAAENPAFRNDLAASLMNLGNHYSGVGRRADAIAPTEEAVEIYRPLAAENPAFRNDLASSLNNLGNRYGEVGRHADAVAPTEEAVEIRRQLAAENLAFLNDLASSLNNLGIRYGEVGRRADAVAPTEEAVEILRPLAAENPAFLGDLARSLMNLGIRYSEVGRRADAVAPTEEAVEIYRPLAAENPAFLNDLASSLNNLGDLLEGLGRDRDAAQAREQAAKVLSSEPPDR